MTRDNDNKTVVIEMDGTYRITARMGYTNSCGSNAQSWHHISITKNGATISKQIGSLNCCGYLSEIFQLNKGDRLQIASCCSNAHSTEAHMNCFMIEKL